MRTEIVESISKIDKNMWEELVENNFPETRYEWCKTVEESGNNNLRYVLAFERNKLIGVAICEIVKEKLFRFGISLKIIEVSSPLSNFEGFIIKDEKAILPIIKEIENLVSKEKLMGISFMNLRENMKKKIEKSLKGYHGIRLSPNTFIDINWDNFEEYLSSLKSGARRGIRNTLRRKDRYKLRIEHTKEFKKFSEQLYQLQKKVCDFHRDYKYLLPSKFYESLEKNFKDNSEVTICFKNEKILGFVLSLMDEEKIVYKFCGLDPKYKKYQAYFLFYIDGIKRAIKNKKKRIYFGKTTYGVKTERGCTKENLYAFLKARNSVLNKLASLYFKLLEKKFLKETQI